MHMIGFASMMIYNIFILVYFKKIFPVKRTYWLYSVAVVVINMCGLYCLLLYQGNGSYLVMMGVIMLSFYLLFRGNWVQILYAGSIYIFSLYSSRGIIMSVYYIALHEINYNMIITLAVLLSIITIKFLRKVIIPDNKARHLLSNKGQLKFVVTYLLFQLVILMFINDGCYYDDKRQSWLSTLYLGSCVISKLCLVFVFDHTSKVVELFEYELHTRKLQEQLSRQILHYQSYSRFTESYRAFRHDYKNMMTSVKTLLRNQEYDKAIRMLDDIHDTMQRNVLTHKTYSDNAILDAILQDAANSCEEKGIRFTAVAYLPENIMTELDVVRVFSNIIDNAIEACDKLSGPNRFIEITSNVSEGWINIEISNSFNGELKIVNDMPETTKDDKDFHGLGLRIVTEVIEGLGGLVFFEPDRAKKIFRTRLCIPKALS